MKIFKYTLASLIALFCFISTVKAEKIGLEWNYPEDQQIDGFRIFQTSPVQNADGTWSETFDYTQPVLELPPDSRSAEIELPGRSDQITKYVFVIRAYRGSMESADSNSASYKVNLIKPDTPVNLQGSYDDETKIISLSWEQPNKEGVYKWIVYYRVGVNDQFIELGSVNKDQELTLNKTFDAAPDNALTNVYFSVVAFRRDQTAFSDNSVEFMVAIDRRDETVIPPENLQINIEIPVQ